MAQAQASWDGCSQYDPDPWPWRDSGKWGEAPGAAPPDALRQESRAPKMPSADRYFAGLGGARKKSLSDGLLICHVETYSRDQSARPFYRYKLGAPNPKRPSCGLDWDVFAGPDTLLRFRFRDDYPIALFGPEDHWGFFVSIPRMSLAPGDRLAVKIWDRDSGSSLTGNFNPKKDEFMGAAELVYDGTLPFTMKSMFFTLRCNGMNGPEVLARVKGWLAASDHYLKQAAAWQPKVDAIDFGHNDALTLLLGDFGRGNLRYPAGFLGWDHTEITTRLTRARAIKDEDATKRRTFTEKLVGRSPPLKVGAALGNGVQLKALSCAQGSCELTLQAPFDLCKKPFLFGVSSIGDFHAATVTKIGEDCHSATATLAGAVLLWIGGRTFKL
jgi:hypothetical protein